MDVDYRKFRLNKLNTPEFRHIYLLLFWPIYGLVFFYLERIRPVAEYHTMHCVLDDHIPFCEWFVFPYLLWFLFFGGMVALTFFIDVKAFKHMMQFIIITHAIAIFIFFVYPNSQNLRPEVFPRDNILTRFMAGFYAFDTNTNVCPSLHVVGSVAAMFAGWDSKYFSSRGWKIVFAITTVLISISTVFLKQHSATDILVAIPICLLGYWLVYRLPETVAYRAGSSVFKKKEETSV